MKKLALAVGIAAIPFAVAVCYGQAGLDALVALLFGWVGFLLRVLPRVTVDRPSVAVGVLAIVLFTAGVHAAGRAWHGRGWKLPWTLSGVGGVFLLFAAGISLVAATHQGVWLSTAREPAVVPKVKRYFGSYDSHTNLRVIGVSLFNHQDSMGAFPYTPTFAPDGTMRHSWATALLPFIPYDTQQINQELPWYHPQNQPAFHAVIPEFINPELDATELTDAQGHGLCHYAANSRVLGAGARLRSGSLGDRGSTTLLIGEVNARFRPWGHPVNWRDPALGINRSAEGFGGPRGAGGAQFLMGDGSARFLSERISPDVLRRLATPAGGPIDESLLEAR